MRNKFVALDPEVAKAVADLDANELRDLARIYQRWAAQISSKADEMDGAGMPVCLERALLRGGNKDLN